jgi:hypothetical protein
VGSITLPKRGAEGEEAASCNESGVSARRFGLRVQGEIELGDEFF